MLYRHVFDKISTEFCGILHVLMSRNIRSPDYELRHIYKLATKNLHLATIFLQLVAKRRPEDFFNFEPCPRNSREKGGWTIKITFQGVNFKLSMKIATYWSGRSFLKTYCKIPKISPGAYIFQRHFWRGLFSEELIFGGAYLRSEINYFAFQNRLG